MILSNVPALTTDQTLHIHLECPSYRHIHLHLMLMLYFHISDLNYPRLSALCQERVQFDKNTLYNLLGREGGTAPSPARCLLPHSHLLVLVHNPYFKIELGPLEICNDKIISTQSVVII